MPRASRASVDIAARVLVLDEGGAIATQVRELLPTAITVRETRSIDDALSALVDEDIAVMVVELTSANGDVASALKALKRIRPATLAIVVSPLRDSRVIISLINEGQIFRFLLQPPVKELLRRGLIAALERHAELSTATALQRRHAVEAAPAAQASLSGRLAQVWQRIRNSTLARGVRVG
jgi:response regulator RpfG family c-di-GMP phosphodiesterase